MSRRDIEHTFDSIAEDFNRTRSKAWPEVIEFVEQLETKGTFLDIGCGNGKDTVLLLKNGFNTVSMDISENQCSIAKQNIVYAGFEIDSVKVLQADMRELPFEENSFDGALFLASLHHLETEVDRSKALGEVYRCLKPGAVGLISVWAFDQPRFDADLERQSSGEKGEKDGKEFGDLYVPWTKPDGAIVERFYHLFLPDEFQKLANSIGFSNTEFFTSRGNHFCKFIR